MHSGRSLRVEGVGECARGRRAILRQWGIRGRWAVEAVKERFWARRLVLLAGMVGLTAWLGISCAEFQGTVVNPARVAGAEYVGNQACYDCHTNVSRIFPSSPHAQIDTGHGLGLTGCESCHGPGSKHVQAGGGRGVFIVNPGNDPEACMDCHLDVRAQFHLPYHHPLMERGMNCVRCHDPHGMDIMKPAGGLAMARENQQCTQCHQEQARLFVFVHEALQEGCTECHYPHGSVHADLLSARDNNLCLRCHAQVPVGSALLIGGVNHGPRLMQGTCWSAGCHTAVHGSNVHPRLFY